MVPGTAFVKYSLAEQHHQELLKAAANLKLAREATAETTVPHRQSVRERLSAVANTVIRSFEATAAPPPESPARYRGNR